MLNVEFGKIGNNNFVNLILEEGDLEVIESLASEEFFLASNGYGLNFQDILEGKTCVPCRDEEEFKNIKLAVEEFNEEYLSDDTISESYIKDVILKSTGLSREELSIMIEDILKSILLEREDKDIESKIIQLTEENAELRKSLKLLKDWIIRN